VGFWFRACEIVYSIHASIVLNVSLLPHPFGVSKRAGLDPSHFKLLGAIDTRDTPSPTWYQISRSHGILLFALLI